jgi:DNA-binding response OmpR family regulator
MRRLREKIEDDPATPTRIVTVWGVGYRYEAA